MGLFLRCVSIPQWFSIIFKKGTTFMASLLLAWTMRSLQYGSSLEGKNVLLDPHAYASKAYQHCLWTLQSSTSFWGTLCYKACEIKIDKWTIWPVCEYEPFVQRGATRLNFVTMCRILYMVNKMIWTLKFNLIIFSHFYKGNEFRDVLFVFADE